jgi:hypothetical protein
MPVATPAAYDAAAAAVAAGDDPLDGAKARPAEPLLVMLYRTAAAAAAGGV